MEINVQSDVGRKRNTNQDYANVFENQQHITFAVLADGMGGHQAGDVASQMAVNNLGESWSNASVDSAEKSAQWLIQAIQKENEKIYERGQLKPEYLGMGTTVVGAILLPDSFVLANVGDSRAYLVRDQHMLQLTEDHSLVNELVKSGEITREMAANHPRKNVLTRSLGMPGTVEVDVTNHEWLPNDYLLLCSDGLTNMVSETKILEILETSDPLESKLSQLVAQANEAGGLDNITVLVIHFDEQKEENQ
ncbi:TPA: Stp1/IreP family PP2C-type Ser/Thr phosphatase [Enterococcus faecalis]